MKLKCLLALFGCCLMLGLSAETLLKTDFSDGNIFRQSMKGDVEGKTAGKWNGFDNQNFAIAKHPDSEEKSVLRIERVGAKMINVAPSCNVPENRKMKFRFRVYPGVDGDACFMIRFFNSKENKTVGSIRIDSGRQHIIGVVGGRQFSGIACQSAQWQEFVLVFEPRMEKYLIQRILPDGSVQKGSLIPYENNLPIDRIDIANYPGMPGKKNVALIDLIELSCEDVASLEGRANVISSASEAKAFLVGKDGKLTPAPQLNDNDLSGESAVTIPELPAELLFEMPSAQSVSTVRLFSGNLGYVNNKSGEVAVTGYKVEVLSTQSGQWLEVANRSNLPGAKEVKAENHQGFFDACDFPPLEVSQLRITLLTSNDTGKRHDPNARPKPMAIVREVELYTHSPKENPTSLNNVLAAEYRVPVYRYQDQAELYAILDKSIPEMRVQISFKERFNNSIPADPMVVTLHAGENIIPVDIRNWKNGEYRTSIRSWGKDAPVSGEFGRLLRLDRLPDSIPPKHAEDMTGKKMFFPDRWWLQNSDNLTFEEELPEVRQASTPNIRPDELVQLADSVGFDKQNRVVVSFRGMHRNWDAQTSVRRYARADLNDLEKWELGEGNPPDVDFTRADFTNAMCGKFGWRDELGNPAIRFRFYDAEKDGPVELDKVQIVHVGYKPRDFGVVKPKAQSTWLLYPKDGEYLLLWNKPFLQDSYSSGEFEDPINSNDNFGGQWLSEDGRTLCYVRGRLLKRYAPFVSKYDNLWPVSRILTVFTTQDGVNWERHYFGLPDEQDPPNAQHYGGQVYRVPGGDGLMVCYAYSYLAREQQYYLELYYSWDGYTWKRYPGHKPWVAPGKPGDWNFGTTTLHNNIAERDGKLYHTIGWAAMGPHFSGDFLYSDQRVAELSGEWLKKRYGGKDLESWPFFRHYGSYDKMAKEFRKYGFSVGLMIYRKNGWFKITAGNKPGVMITRPIRAEGSMTANLKIGDGGMAHFTLLDATDKVIPGYNRTVEKYDGVNCEIFPTLPHGEFKVKVELKNGALYDLGF